MPTPHDRWGRLFRPHELGEGEPREWYRLMVFDRPVGPWRPSIQDVTADALDLGHASRSKRYRRVFLTVPAWVARLDLYNGRAHRL